MSLRTTVRPFAAALAGVAAVATAAVLTRTSAPAPPPAAPVPADEPRYTVTRSAGRIILPIVPTGEAADRLAAAALALAHDSSRCRPVGAGEWEAATDGSSVVFAFGRRPLLVVGDPPAPAAVDELAVGFSPIRVVARCEDRYYRFDAARYRAVAQVQHLLAAAALPRPDVLDEPHPTYDRLLAGFQGGGPRDTDSPGNAPPPVPVARPGE